MIFVRKGFDERQLWCPNHDTELHSYPKTYRFVFPQSYTQVKMQMEITFAHLFPAGLVSPIGRLVGKPASLEVM